jgi:hypothetical protein
VVNFFSKMLLRTGYFCSAHNCGLSGKNTKLQFQNSVSHWTPNCSVSFLGTADARMCKYTVVNIAEQLKHYKLINKQNYCQIGKEPSTNADTCANKQKAFEYIILD